MNKQLCFLFFLISFSLFGQKKVEKSWSSNSIKNIVINGNGIFKIEVSNSETKTISLQAKIDGEYAEHLVLIDSISNQSLVLSTAFQPLFKINNDKLSAHKVLSVEFKLLVPKFMSLDIVSDIGSVNISGTFPSVFIELQDGNCRLNPFFGNATINTIDGNIDIATNNTKTKAFTKTGTKRITEFKFVGYYFNLHSINGNIAVTKAKK